MTKLAYAQWPWGVETKEQFIQSCKDLSSLDYRYFESIRTFIDVFLGDVQSFLSLTDEYDLHPISFYFHMSKDPKADIQELKKKIDFVKACNIKTICVQGVWTKEKTTEESLRTTLGVIQEFGNICKDYGILPCVHPHANTPIMYENEIDFIMKNTDPALIGFAPDTAHLTVGRCDPLKIFERYKNRIAFTHIKDVRGKLDSTGMQGGVEVYSNFLELGEGTVDFESIFKLLKDIKYDGYLCVELDTPPVSNLASAKKNMEFMKQHWGSFEE